MNLELQEDWTPQIDFVWGRGVSSGMITFSCWLCAVTNKLYWSLLSKSAHWCVAKSRFWKSVKLCWDKWKDVRRAINTAILLCNKTKQLYYNYMSCWTLFRVKNLHFIVHSLNFSDGLATSCEFQDSQCWKLCNMISRGQQYARKTSPIGLWKPILRLTSRSEHSKCINGKRRAHLVWWQMYFVL